MNIQAEIENEHSKAQATRIANYIGNDPMLFAELMDLFLSSSYRINQRSALVASYCTDQFPDLILPHLDQIVENLQKPIHDAVKRNTLRILQHVSIPEKLLGSLATSCFDFLTSKQEPVAIKVFAMTVLANIAQKEPDLRQELKLCIEEQMSYASAAFASRGNKILKQLNKVY